MPRLKLTIAYVGTHYHGWQLQLRPGAAVPTVQGFVEAAVAHVAGVPCHVHGSGRTDAGVHAEAQVAHVDVPSHCLKVDWQLALNTLLPADIRIRSVELVDDDFHAQFSAVSKRYEYHLWTSQRYTPPWRYPFVWSCGRVDVDAMREVIPVFEGRHDFASLQNTGSNVLTSVRTLRHIGMSPDDVHGVVDSEQELVWSFEADGFLKQMVRNCMGLLVAVGRHKLSKADVEQIIEAKDRCHVGVTAPAKGLILKWVRYA